jgi:hypothetical protein
MVKLPFILSKDNDDVLFALQTSTPTSVTNMEAASHLKCQNCQNKNTYMMSEFIEHKHLVVSVKGALHSQLNWAILLCDVVPDGKTE